MNRFYFVLILIAILLMACEKETLESTLSVDKEIIEFPSEGGTQTLHISSNTDWVITSPNNKLKLSVTEGSNSSDITITMPKVDGTKVIEFRLTIKTLDGTVVLNVTIRQEGEYRDGDYMKVTNKPNLFFNGEANSMDSIVINSNLGWKVQGPEWLEGYYNNKWIPLSRTIIGNGNAHIKIRTTSSYDEEEDRVDTLRIIQPYEGNKTENIKVAQTGKYKINIKNTYSTFNSLAYELVFGNKVDSYWYYLSERELKKEDFTTDNIGKWSHSTRDDQNRFQDWFNLSEDTYYYLYFATATENNKLKLNGKLLKTYKKGEYPIVNILSVRYEENCWYWTTEPGNDVVEYYVAAFSYSKNPEMFMWSDAHLLQYMHVGNHIRSFKLSNGTKKWKHETSSDILIITQAVGRDLMWSGEISRYIGKIN